jgi:hypothetical protein
VDVEVSVYAWPTLAIASEARLGFDATGDDTWLQLVLSSAHGAVMRVFPGFSEEFAVFTQPSVDRVARFTAEESLPLGPGVFSSDERHAAFLVMHWWSARDDRLVRRRAESILWATLHLVHLRDHRSSEHPVLVRLPPDWRPGEELEDAAFRLARDPRTMRFEEDGTLVFDLPWGGQVRVSVPPPPEGILAPAPLSTPESMLDRIRANAALVISLASKELGQDVGFDEAGVRWLDGFIQRQHDHGDPAIRTGLTQTLGSYLGECVLQCFGGSWAEDADGRLGVRFSEGNYAFPFAKVEKQLSNGAEDSVLSFFRAIPLVFKIHGRS